MKKISILLILASVFFFDTKQLSAQAYESGSKVLNLGVGVGGRHALGIGAIASFEVGIWETGDFGVIGLGVMGGVRYATNAVFLDDYRYTEIAVAPRGTYHFTVIPVEDLDVYAAVQIVFDFENRSSKNNNSADRTSTIVYPAFIAGVRYYFSDSFGVFAELGYNLTYLTGGIALKF